MSAKTIHKQTAATLRRRGENYTTVPSSTIALISNPVSLAILVYLLDKPDNWVVRRTDVMKRFGIGRERHDLAVKTLKDLGLYWTEQVRGERGKIVGNNIYVSATPIEPECRKTHSPENPQSGKPTVRKTHSPAEPQSGEPTVRETHRPESPPCGKPDHLHITDVLHTTDCLHSSEPDGSAASAVKPVDNSRLARFGNFYDLPDQDLDSPQENLFTVGVRVLGKYGIESPRARSLLAKLKSDHGQGPTLDALTELVCREPSSNPIGWLQTLLKSERREMPHDWKPSPGVVSTLQGLGIPMPVIDNARAFFKLWVLDRAIASNDFDGWFVEWCIRDFEDAECDVNRQAGWYGNAKAQEFHEPAGGCLA